MSKLAFDVDAYWRDYFDWSCRCGFPHPKPPNVGPPPEYVERDGVVYQLPRYNGVMGSDHPIPRKPVVARSVESSHT
jgi:hypothetical protein